MEFEFKEKTYRVNKVPAMKQFYVARRFAGPLMQFGGLINDLAKVDLTDLEKVDIAPLISGLCGALQNLEDKDAEFIFNTALEASQLQDGAGWAPMRKSGVTMYQLELDELIYIVLQFLKENFQGFLAALSSRAQGRTSSVNG